MPVEKVKFKSGNVNCAADLYIPEGRRAGARGPGLVIGHGFSFVREALVDEAGYFQRAGYVVLAITTGALEKARASRGASFFRLMKSRTTGTLSAFWRRAMRSTRPASLSGGPASGER